MTISGEIAAMGQGLGPDVIARCRELFDAEQRELAQELPVWQAEIRYGADERQVLDIYAPAEFEAPLPVIVFFHGGGFVRGDKGGATGWHNANVARMAAKMGYLGIAANYRLAPQYQYPAGAEDVAAVVDWLRGNASELGADPARICLAGTSAGAVHVACYLDLRKETAKSEVTGAVLLSGLYGYTPLERNDHSYFVSQESYVSCAPLRSVVETQVPLLVACSQFDPPRFQSEFISLLSDRQAFHGTLPSTFFGIGHNHYSLAMHLGTSDRRMADAINGFVTSLPSIGS